MFWGLIWLARGMTITWRARVQNHMEASSLIKYGIITGMTWRFKQLRVAWESQDDSRFLGRESERKSEGTRRWHQKLEGFFRPSLGMRTAALRCLLSVTSVSLRPAQITGGRIRPPPLIRGWQSHTAQGHVQCQMLLRPYCKIQSTNILP